MLIFAALQAKRKLQPQSPGG